MAQNLDTKRLGTCKNAYLKVISLSLRLKAFSNLFLSSAHRGRSWCSPAPVLRLTLSYCSLGIIATSRYTKRNSCKAAIVSRNALVVGFIVWWSFLKLQLFCCKHLIFPALETTCVNWLDRGTRKSWTNYEYIFEDYAYHLKKQNHPS